ncbi:MAG: HAMP domain-containing sensor histidine kinase [Acidobacteriota bacterium]
MPELVRRLGRMAALRSALALTAVFVLVSLLAGGAAAWLLEQELEALVDTTLTERHAELGAQLDAAGELERLAATYDEWSKSHRMELWSFETDAGRTLGEPTPQVLETTGYSYVDLEGIFPTERDDWRVFVAPTEGGRLAVAVSAENILESMEIVRNTFLAVGLVVSLVAIAGGLAVGVATQRRHDRILSTLQAISDGNLSARVSPEHDRDDVDTLARRIDESTARTEKLLQQTRGLSVNIAHDLKTPLARLRAQLEREFPASPERESALGQVDGVIESFDGILQIARVEAGDAKTLFAGVSLTDLAETVVATFGPVAEDSGCTLALRPLADPTVLGERGLLVQLVANLVENSLQHGGTSTRIEVGVTPVGIEVLDDGPGIPADERSEVLAPHYRREQSRSTPGHGLGLALAKAIAELHDAELSLTDREDGRGLRARVVFPARAFLTSS